MNREHGIGQTAATILKLLDITPGREMEGPHKKVLDMARQELTGKGSRRAFFYNPDAIGMWLYRKYQETHFQRAYSIEEIRGLLCDAGMSLEEIWDADTLGKPCPQTQRLYFIAREQGK